LGMSESQLSYFGVTGSRNGEWTNPAREHGADVKKPKGEDEILPRSKTGKGAQEGGEEKK